MIYEAFTLDNQRNGRTAILRKNKLGDYDLQLYQSGDYRDENRGKILFEDHGNS